MCAPGIAGTPQHVIRKLQRVITPSDGAATGLVASVDRRLIHEHGLKFF